MALDKKYLLTTRQMATFVAKGFLRFDDVVPAELNERIMHEIDAGGVKASRAATPLSQCYAGTAVKEMLDMPEVQGMIQSLVGPDPLFDHQAVHVRQPNEAAAQGMHGDSIIDTSRQGTMNRNRPLTRPPQAWPSTNFRVTMFIARDRRGGGAPCAATP
jgi:hypothetical protein